MDSKDETQKKSKSKIVIILLLVVMVLSGIIGGYVIAGNKDGVNIMKIFNSEGEYTAQLGEFVINLKSNNLNDHYLKMTIGLMYTKAKQGEVIEANGSKIRDAVINVLRSKTYDEMLDNNNTKELKTELIEVINGALNQEIIKEIYITNIVIQ